MYLPGRFALNDPQVKYWTANLRDQPAQDQPANGTSPFTISGTLYFQILLWENQKEVFYWRGIVFIHKDENKVES